MAACKAWLFLGYFSSASCGDRLQAVVSCVGGEAQSALETNKDLRLLIVALHGELVGI